MSNELTRVDSAVAGVSFEEELPLKQRIPHSRRRSSDTSGVQNIKDLGTFSCLCSVTIFTLLPAHGRLLILPRSFREERD